MSIVGVYELKNAQFYVNFFNDKGALSGWHKDYNMQRNFAQHFRMNYLLEKCNNALEHLANAETIMSQQLPMFFSKETTVEWIESYITPMKSIVYTKKVQAESALKTDTWPRRPIHRHSP